MPNYTEQLKRDGNLLTRSQPKGKAPRRRIPKMSQRKIAFLKALEAARARGEMPPSPLKRRRIPRVTKKRAKQVAEYAKIRKDLLAEHPWCQIWLKRNGFDEDQVEGEGYIEIDWDNGCGVVGTISVPRSEELHHPAGRIGEKLIDKTNLLCVSREEHIWLHAHPKEARRLGLLK